MLRVSAKLGTARPDQLPPDLRQNFLDAIQSSWAEHTLQGSVRPGCTNLILGALEPVSPCTPARMYHIIISCTCLLQQHSIQTVLSEPFIAHVCTWDSPC